MDRPALTELRVLHFAQRVPTVTSPSQRRNRCGFGDAPPGLRVAQDLTMVLEFRKDAPVPQPRLTPLDTPPPAADPLGGVGDVGTINPAPGGLGDRVTRTDGDGPTLLDPTRTGGVAQGRPPVDQVGSGSPYLPGGLPPADPSDLGGASARNRPTGILTNDPIVLAQARSPQGAGGVAVGGGGGVQAVAPTGPGAPLDLSRMEALNNRIQAYNNATSPVPEATLNQIKADSQAATDALRRGDYAAAQQALSRMGFPLPTPGSGTPSTTAAITAHMLGASQATGTRGGTWSVGAFNYGARGDQSVNDLNSFAANARMMATLGNSVSNPPTEAQLMAHMRNFANPPPPATRPDAAAIMARASLITDGMINHYSSAGASDPQYGANPNPRFAVRSGSNVQVYDTEAAARTASAATRPPGTITRLNTRSPDEWSDISSQGDRSGRHIGDCESKVYLQTRLLTEAGFTSLGSIDVQPDGGGMGHMFGVFRSGNRVFVTSNEGFQEVRGSGANGAVTQADLDSTVRSMTADVYHVRPNAQGIRDTSAYRISMARTDPPGGTAQGVASIRAATENGMIRRNQPLLP